MAKTIDFTAFSSPSVLFATREAANSFFANISIASATTTEEGVVKMAALVTYAAPVIAATVPINIDIIQGDGSSLVVQAPSLASYEELRQAVVDLTAALAAAVANMKTAGSMSTS